MKTFFKKTLPVAALMALVCSNRTALAQAYDLDGDDWGGGIDLRSVLTINPDGSCAFVMTTIEPRAAAEQQIRLRERYEKMAEQAGNLEQPPVPEATATNDVKPLTDEELSQKCSAMMEDRADNAGEKIEVEIKTNTVAIISSRLFASIEDMLKESVSFGRGGAVTFGNARFETDTNGWLRVTFLPEPGMERYAKAFRSQWKLSGARSEFKMVFPGKVIASDFAGTQSNATWLVVDGRKDETLDAAVKFYTAPAVVTAEAGGLKLAQPLEAKKLWRSRRMVTADDDLPLTEAGPGFVAEAQSITTTTLHVFPDGEEYFKNNAVGTGAVVNAKVFAPKGRMLLSLRGAHVLSAVDNQGRSVATENGEDSGFSETTASGSEDASSMQIQLRLQLPQPDAQAIDKISAEVEAVTAGSWKEMPLTNLQENATNELDLSAVLPATKMAITKVSFKNGQLNLQARLHGPAAASRLELRAKIPGKENFHSYSSDRKTSKKGGEITRTIMVQGYGFEDPDALSQGAVTLVVRYPEGLKREHITFDLKGLDLF